MVDPLISLAFVTYSNPGTYALLLGSGVSRSAKIPTGWEITLNLIRQVAAVENAEPSPTPEKWWQETRGKAPDYGEILDAIARFPAERQQLLKRYFEPTEEERAEGSKLPMPGHRAIARLIASGFIRIVVTTNFDRLLEMSLQEVGISPVVISTSDQVAGMMPLAHSGPTIVKVNGDYLDTRIRNTAAELATYDENLGRLLAQIFDEYGLIICGWSADWDLALADAITRTQSRRFTTFWTTRDAPSVKAQRLINDRRAQVVEIAAADSFFTTLEAKVQALSDMNASHPLSAEIAVAIEKRYLADPHEEIRLHDLVTSEVERTYCALGYEHFPVESSARLEPEVTEELRIRLERYEAALQTILCLVITGAYWGAPRSVRLWVSAIERLANRVPQSGSIWLLPLRLYPALLLQYGAGIAAVAAGKFDTLAAVLVRPMFHDSPENRPVINAVNPWTVLPQGIRTLIPKTGHFFTPVTNHVYAVLRSYFSQFLVQDTDYQRTFDWFEYVAALTQLDLNLKSRRQGWGSPGAYVWRGGNSGSPTMVQFEAEIEEQGQEWPPLQVGLLDGSSVRAKELSKTLRELTDRLGWS